MADISTYKTSIPKAQEVHAEFELDSCPIRISVRRHKNYKSLFSVEQDGKVVKEGSIRSVNLSNCLLEIVRANKYLPYCNLVMAWSTYKFAKALVDIRLHPSGDGSWEVRIRYNNRIMVNKQYPSNMSQGDVMNTLIQDLGIPERNQY